MAVVLILAAGRSARMRGADKLLEPVGGMALLRRLVLAARATGARVLVTLPAAAEARRAVLLGSGCEILEIAAAQEGMAASLRAGAAAAGGEALMVLPGDMPEIDRADLGAMLAAHAAWPEAVLRGATRDGRPGHPVLFPADLVPDLLGLRGDSGARAVLARHAARMQLVALPGDHALCDLDTPEDWAEWRKRNGA